jgi:tripeptide aminopeptidase
MDSRLLETFLELVRIDSPTGREALVAAYAADALKRAGCEVVFDDSAFETGSDTGNLLAILPGAPDAPKLVFSAHMDCVQPCEGVEPVIADGVIRSAGETVLGADDKAGVAAIIEAVRRLQESDAPHAEIRVALTTAEEIGLRGAKALGNRAFDADLCLVLDADGPVGGIVVGAPTHYTFTAVFTGKAAHAGVEPEVGVSAITMASRAVAAMSLGRLDDHTTANIGTIAGGSATNVVAPRVEMTGECRSIDRERVEQVRSAMDETMKQAASAAGGTVEVFWVKEYDGFRVPDDHPALALVEGALGALGIESRKFLTGGGSDGNVFAARGVTTVVLASGMSTVHSAHEMLPISELERLAALLVEVAHRAVG